MEKRGNIEIIELNDQLRISFPWSSFVAYFILFFALITNIGMLYGVFNIPISDGSKWILYLMYFPFLVFLYYSLANLLNKTHLIVKDSKLKIRMGPLPWPGSKSFNLDELSQFYILQKTSSSRNAGRRTITISYQVHVVLSNGKHKKVLDGLAIPDLETAKFIEEKLENYLGIENRSVEGEYKGDPNRRFLSTGL